MNIDEAIKRHKATATKGNVIFSNNPDLAKKTQQGTRTDCRVA